MSEFSETMFFIHALQNVQVQYTKKIHTKMNKTFIKQHLNMV